MNSPVTQLTAPSRRRDRTRLRLTVASAVVAVAAFLAAAAAAAAFIPWGNRYEAIAYQAIETSTTARYPQGFLITGVLEGTALVLMTATALLAVAATVTGRRIQAMRADTLAFSAVAALLAATVLPAAVLDGYLAAVPAIAVIAAVALALPARPGAVSISAGELAGWGVAIIAADALFSGLGVLVAAAAAFTRLRHASSAQRWGVGLFSLLVAMVHVLTIGGGPALLCRSSQTISIG